MKYATIGIYKDTTNLYTDEECDIDNELVVKAPYDRLSQWVRENHNTTYEDFFKWYTYDDTIFLFQDLKDCIQIVG